MFFARPWFLISRAAYTRFQYYIFAPNAQWFIWEVCDFTYLGIIHDWGHGSICPWNEVNFKGSGARLTPQNMQTCHRSVPKMTLKKVSREFLNQSPLESHSIPSTLRNRTVLRPIPNHSNQNRWWWIEIDPKKFPRLSARTVEGFCMLKLPNLNLTDIEKEGGMGEFR